MSTRIVPAFAGRSVIVATIFGNVSIIIMNFSADQSAYRKKMESLYENMHHLQLPQGASSPSREGHLPDSSVCGVSFFWECVAVCSAQ